MRPLLRTVRMGLLALLISGVPMAPVDAQPRLPSVTFVLRPDSITVGTPFVLTVRAQVPAGARLTWPLLTDTAAAVRMNHPPREIPEGMRLGRMQLRAEYDLTAWAVGTVPIGLGELRVMVGAQEERVSLAEAMVTVRSVLTGDPATRVPRPARDLFPRLVPWWRRWWPVALLLALMALLAALRRRRRISPKASIAATGSDPYREAMQQFDRMAQLQLPEAGEGGRAAILAQEIVRQYLCARVPAATHTLTSAELLVVVADDPRIPRDALTSLLADVDRLKFAARRVTPGHVGELLKNSRSVVEAIEHADQAQRRALLEAERLATAAAARERAAEEERARRASRQRDGAR